MGQQIIKGTEKLSEMIKSRRQELGLTIEEAASKAGVGTKTWYRYESGESIRKDKSKGICKALNWHVFPEENSELFNIHEYRSHVAWSEYISEYYGEAAAVSLVIGSDILLDYIEEDLWELSKKPKGTHLGQLDVSMLKEMLPVQFLMRYNYDFLYCLKTKVIKLRGIAHYGTHLMPNSVIEELAIYLISEAAEFLMDTLSLEMENAGMENVENWKEWIFDLFGDMDIVSCLYSDIYLTNDHIYHFEHWIEEQFYK